MRGIDISHWNGDIDFNKVRADGIEFVIIKAGGSDRGFYKDPKFETNYEKAKAAGLSIGAYYFVGKNFYGVVSGAADAKRFISIIKGKEFDYPVFVDVETTDFRFKEMATDAAIAFCTELEKAGYFVGVYASDISGYRERLNHERLMNYTHWVARYGKVPEECTEHSIWQQSSKGSVKGISGSVDIDESKVDFPKIIKTKGLNGFKKISAETENINKKSAEKKQKPKKFLKKSED